MAKIGIYLPKYYRVEGENLLKPIDDVLLRKEVLKIANRLTDLCGGCTSTEVTGYYKFKDGFFSEHPTIELYCFCNDKDTALIARELKPFLTDVCLRLAQTSVGMYINDRFVEL